MAAGNSTSDPWEAQAAPLPAGEFALRSALTLLAVCATLWVAGWLTQGSALAWPRFEDDGYYYLVIARNAALGHGFTADGLSPTNGFQPLWMWLLVAFTWLTSVDTTWQLAAAHVLVVAVFAGAGSLLCALLRTRFRPLPVLCAAAVLVFPPYLNVLLSGLESGIAVLVLVLLVRELVRSGVLGPREAEPADLRAGVLLGLLMLARLDSVFIGIALTGYLAAAEWLQRDRTPSARLVRIARKGLAVFWPTLALVAPYLAWNLARFGHVVPISGALKTSLATPGFRPENLNVRNAGLLLLVLAAVAVERRRARDARLAAVLVALAAGLVLHSAYALVFMQWAVFTWHYALFIPVGAIAAAVLARAVLEHAPHGANAWLAAGLAALVALAQALSISRLPLTFTGAAREAGIWVSGNLPSDAILGMKDSGAFAYFAQRRVMNLDGVVNSFEYEEALCRGELASFLRAHGVTYVAQHAVPPDVRIGAYQTFTQRYPCHFPGGRDSQLVFTREREVFRGAPYRSFAGSEDQVVIWRIADAT